MHLNEPPQCTDCVLFMSPGLKPYKCSQCDYASRSKSNLKAHMNRHSTEKTHLCDLCGKKFKSKCTLKSHKLMHTADGESLSLCLIPYAVLLLFLSTSTRLALSDVFPSGLGQGYQTSVWGLQGDARGGMENVQTIF